MLRAICILVAVTIASLASFTPARADPLRYFYCYVVDPSKEQVFVSDMHEVGPIAERGSYGRQYVDYLSAKRLVSPQAKAYCVMRSTEPEIARGLRDLPAICPECGGLDTFTPVAWLRRGKGVRDVLAGKLVLPAPKAASVLTQNSEIAPDDAQLAAQAVAQAVEGEGVWVRVGHDMTDVVYSANEPNGDFRTRHLADQKGGKWTVLLANNRCPGWIGVAYASNGTDRWYYAAQGGLSEGDANREALRAAQEMADKSRGTWITGVLISIHNEFRLEPTDIAGTVKQHGAVGAATRVIRKAVTSGCTRNGGRMAGVGVRG